MPLNVEHPCYNVPPAERNGHSCWNNATQENQEGLNARIAQLEAELSDSHTELSQFNARIAQLEAELSASQSAQDPLNEHIAQLEAELSASQSAQDPLNERIAQLEAELTDSHAELSQFTARIAQLEAELSDSNSAQQPLNATTQKHQPLGSERDQKHGGDDAQSITDKINKMIARVGGEENMKIIMKARDRALEKCMTGDTGGHLIIRALRDEQVKDCQAKLSHMLDHKPKAVSETYCDCSAHDMLSDLEFAINYLSPQ